MLVLYLAGAAALAWSMVAFARNARAGDAGDGGVALGWRRAALITLVFLIAMAVGLWAAGVALA